jgi:hypothetical protein
MIDFTDLTATPSDGGHLTPEQVDTIEDYLRQVLTALDLSHWRVYVAKDLPPEDCRAMIEPTDGRRIAMLHLAADWWVRDDADSKRIDLTHELLHLAHHDAEAGIRRWVTDSGDIAEYVKHIVMGEFKTNLERMVDSLSYVIAPFMPAWPDAD